MSRGILAAEPSSFECVGLKPATHLAILHADRGEFDRQRKSQAIFATDGCGHTWRFFSPIAAMWHFNVVHMIKSRSDERRNRGNGHTWRMPANLIADI